MQQSRLHPPRLPPSGLLTGLSAQFSWESPAVSALWERTNRSNQSSVRAAFADCGSFQFSVANSLGGRRQWCPPLVLMFPRLFLETLGAACPGRPGCLLCIPAPSAPAVCPCLLPIKWAMWSLGSVSFLFLCDCHNRWWCGWQQNPVQRCKSCFVMAQGSET